MASTYADRSFSYNPFSNNEALFDPSGQLVFGKNANGQWVDVSTGQVIEGEPPSGAYYDAGNAGEQWRNFTTGNEFGVNWGELQKNDPDLYDAWGQRSTGFLRDGTGFNHFKVIGYDPKTGTYTTMTKTGDKEGTVEQWGQGADGQWSVVKNLGTQNWDTNRNVTEQGAFNVAKIALAPVAAYGMSEAWNAFSTAYPEVASQITSTWSSLTQPVKDAFGSIENFANSFGGGPADIAGSAPDFGTNWTNNFGSADPFSGPGDFIQPGGTFEGSALNINAPTSYNPMGEWPGAESNLGMPEFEMPPTTTTPGDPYGPNSSQDGSDPTGNFNNTTSGGSNVSSTTTPKGPNAIVKAVMDGLGISETAATLLVTSVPAIASLFSDHGDQTTTSTNGTPQQVAVKNQIADATAARLPEYMQRDRQRADQQMAWGNAAALVPQNYTLPAQVAAPGMVGPTFGANGTGMMGTYRPRGVMGLYG